MKSHIYEVKAKDLMAMIGLPLIPVALFALLMHAGAKWRALPSPRPTLDVDRTILIHQAEASRAKQAAELLLVGDSSCLMDVSARQLTERLGRSALNLGTFSYLDLNSYTLMLRKYTEANPGGLRGVIVLLHPEALRRTSPERYYVEFLEDFFEGDAPSDRGVWSYWPGVDIFKASLLSRALPTPFRGKYGQFYGFSHQLEAFLTREQGSAVDPEPQKFQGNAEYRLAKPLQPASRAFKAAVPGGVKLFAGITPAPEKFVGRNYAGVHEQMLKEWSQWLQAEPLSLPPTLPDNLFVKTTHLSEAGVRLYTERVAEALKPHLR